MQNKGVNVKPRLSDRMWLTFNRRETSPSNFFSSFLAGYVGFGMGIGVWLVLAGSVLLALFTQQLAFTGWVLALILVPLACLIGLYTFFYKLDKERGYLAAIHSHYLKRRKERLERIFGDKDEGV